MQLMPERLRRTRGDDGFTLIEMVMSVAILGIVSATLLGVGTHPRHRGAQHAGVGALPSAQGIRGQGRLEVGQGVHGGVAEEHRSADVGDRGAQVQAGALEQPRREPEPDGGVVVPAAHDNPRTGVDEPEQGLREQLDGLGGGHRPVVDVAADEHGVDPLSIELIIAMLDDAYALDGT